MAWPQVVENPKHLGAFYDQLDGLEAVSLFKVEYDREGPCLRIRAGLPRFPDHPSKRWPREANRVHVVLSFVGVSHLVLEGEGTTIVGELHARHPDNKTVAVEFESPLLRFRFSCIAVYVDDLTAYVSSEAWPA